ncbi:hypothetical protein LDENG_00188720 [Lucifuga dentata]|nr:hypothetical protein LDENG_00188720 [Lucifuga dentata]
MVSLEMNTTDVSVINRLRIILRNINFPIILSNDIRVSDANISTVCFRSTAGFQCRCEDQYRWSCDQCLLYGHCDTIINSTCGCINAFPSDGQYCQFVDQYNFTTCPTPATPQPPTTPPVLHKYMVTLEMNTTDVSVINRLRIILRNISFPIILSNDRRVSDANISTVCFRSTAGFQCRCEDQYRWSCDQCLLYGHCDTIINSTCGCINAFPSDGQYCQFVDQYNFTTCPTPATPQPPTTPPVLHKYMVTLEMNTTDVSVINRLRIILRNISFPIILSNDRRVSDANISTVCFRSTAGFQCRCEDQYRWSCDQCLLYGHCDTIINSTCGCINAFPPDGQYCQSVDQYNFTTCPTPATPQPPTTPPVLHKYMVTLEMNTTDVSVINRLRIILRNISFPIILSNDRRVSDANISTVCFRSTAGFQCRCEDQYRWSCDQCFLYGHCDTIINSTCGCINAFPPDGQYCQSVDQYNFTTCPTPATPQPPTTPPVLHKYLFSLEMNTTDVSVIHQLRIILRNINFPIILSNVRVSDVNISTVCYPSTAGFQCRCEDQYRWSCDQCFLYGPCDTIINSTCGCINAFPRDGRYCRSVDRYNLTACPIPSQSTTTTHPTTTSTTTTTDPVLQVNLSVTLNRTYDVALSDSSSSAYTNLRSEIEPVLNRQYSTLKGFRSVSITRFSQGSTITHIVIETTFIDADEMIKANEELKTELQPVAPVIEVRAVYYSPDQIRLSEEAEIFTGTSITLTTDPPANVNVGPVIGSEWEFARREITDSTRRKIDTSSSTSKLTIKNIIMADAGHYKCILRGTAMHFIQQGRLHITHAPNVQARGTIHIQCKNRTEPDPEPLKCCVQSPFHVKWFQGANTLTLESTTETDENCITHIYNVGDCSGPREITLTCKVDDFPQYQKNTTIFLFAESFTCKDTIYGNGREGDKSSIRCSSGQEGSITARCENGMWKVFSDTCLVTTIKELQIQSMDLVVEDVFPFVQNLSTVVQSEELQITNSSSTIEVIVDILGTISNISTNVSQSVMEEILETVDVIIAENASEAWQFLNANERNVSSILLDSLERLSDGLSGEFAIKTERILLNRTMFNGSFKADLNNSILIEIPNTNISNTFITTIIFSTLNNILPARNTNTSFLNTTLNETVNNDTINAAVVLIKLNATIHNISLSFDKINNTLNLNPQCVFWNFMLFNNLGAWDDEGYICFIIGAAIAKNPLENPGENFTVPVRPCSTVTFFMHYFYLALFFWMLVSGLLLFYRIMMVFSHMSKSTMLAIGFSLGYGCPLIIAVITVAVTAPREGYVRKDEACWLNWNETKALLAFVVPALTIVCINFIILFVVLYKMLRRGVGDATQADEKNALVVIARCLAVLTPLFGLTWGLGVGTMVDNQTTNKGIHIAFAFFNSLQGFFILVFGTLFDSKVRSALLKNLPTSRSGSSQTRSTSGGFSTSSGLNFIRRLRGRRNVYHVSQPGNTTSSGQSESYTNI